MSTYHSTRLSLAGKVNHSDGLATKHADDTIDGHVTIYLSGAGALTISSDDPDSLRSLGSAFHRAASEVEIERAFAAKKTAVSA